MINHRVLLYLEHAEPLQFGVQSASLSLSHRFLKQHEGESEERYPEHELVLAFVLQGVEMAVEEKHVKWLGRAFSRISSSSIYSFGRLELPKLELNGELVSSLVSTVN